MYQKVCCTCKAVVLILAAVVVAVSRSPRSYSPFVLICSNIAFSLTWPASMQVHWNKRKRIRKECDSQRIGLGHQHGRRFIV